MGLLNPVSTVVLAGLFIAGCGPSTGETSSSASASSMTGSASSAPVAEAPAIAKMSPEDPDFTQAIDRYATANEAVRERVAQRLIELAAERGGAAWRNTERPRLIEANTGAGYANVSPEDLEAQLDAYQLEHMGPVLDAMEKIRGPVIVAWALEEAKRSSAPAVRRRRALAMFDEVRPPSDANPPELVELRKALAPPLITGIPNAADILASLRDEFAACHAASAKGQRLKLRLVVKVDPTGKATSVTTAALDIPEPLVACLRKHLLAAPFDPPIDGKEDTLIVPLDLR